MIRLGTTHMVGGRQDERDAWLVADGATLGQSAIKVVINRGDTKAPKVSDNTTLIVLPAEFAYLQPGDVIAISLDLARVRVLYRKDSLHNNFLVTERCDHYCLMCSQPPRDRDDSWIVNEILAAIPLISPETKDLGFTGGEPTLLGDDLLGILRECRDRLPNTAVHVLSNGRRFAEESFAREWSEIRHPDLMVGIPLYADVSQIHDYVVQADGAFDGTLRGILNLKKYSQKVELRIVLHKQTVPHLVRLAQFIVRNLIFLDHVALMGLEITGFTRGNLPILWIDPYDYQKELKEAAGVLAAAGMRVSIYNHPLCIIDPKVWALAVQSISDWKNEYHKECETCAVRARCGGFFASAVHRRSSHIKAVGDNVSA